MDSDPVALPTVISYVHGPHDADIVTLAQRLNEDGVPCDLDLFEMRPAGGWSRWMTEKMTGTDIVLVVCSEPYFNRYHLKEQPGVGKGATFEGGMLGRRVLEAQGSEHGVIPIVFDRADLKWIPEFIPEFIKDETYFVLPDQFEGLYRALTGQNAFVKPPLGKVRRMPPASAPPSQTLGKATAAPAPAQPAATAHTTPPSLPLAFFRLGDGALIFGRYSQLVREKGVISMTLAVEDDEEAANFSRLRSVSRNLSMGWGVDAALVRMRDYREVHRDGKRLVEITLAEEQRPSTFRNRGELQRNHSGPDRAAASPSYTAR